MFLVRKVAVSIFLSLFLLVNPILSQCDLGVRLKVDTMNIDIIPFNDDSCSLVLPFSIGNSGSCDLSLFAVDLTVTTDMPIMLENVIDTITSVPSMTLSNQTLVYTSDLFMGADGMCLDTMDIKWILEFSTETPPMPDLVTIPCPDGGAGSIVVCANDNSLVCGTIGDCVIPIELVSFSGQLNRDEVELTWVTAMELNNEGFIVEHSKDGKSFKELEFVSSYGDSNDKAVYSLIHENPIQGTNYYRLVQRDYDGQTKISDIVVINYLKGQRNFEVFPNPVSDQLNIVHDVSATHLEIYNTQGKLVTKVILDQSGNSTEFDMSDFSDGVYMLQIHAGNIISHHRLIKS